jgi:energy-coupling factor transporter ATP-binding protein EcfA2
LLWRGSSVLDHESILDGAGTTGMTAILRTCQVAFQYPQNRRGLEATSLSVEAGAFLLVTGASGSGKSTLARCLVGLIPHLYDGRLSGEVWLGNLCTADSALWQLCERAGLVFQNPAGQMLAPTVEDEVLFGLENLGLRRDEMASRLETVLQHFQLGSFRTRRPQTLSGGEQQKLALAAIMARQPPVLVLDEPLSMLDSTAAIDLVDHLEKLAQGGTTVVICEHRAGYLDGVPALRRLHMPGRPVAEQPAVPLPLPRIPPFRLRLCDLTVEFGGRPVLDQVGLEASGGEVVAIVGRNGVGKTTLLRALAGLQPSTALYALLLLWARLLPAAARQVWRLKWLLLMLFLIDWLVIDLELTVIITLRLVLLAGSFARFFATTTPVDLCLALEWMRVPYRYAFSVGLEFQSLDLLEGEWNAIHEAQAVRGAWTGDRRWQRVVMRVRNSVALVVPAVVLTTKRAWAITEAAHARGFDSPRRRPFRRLRMTRFDWGLLASAGLACTGLLAWRLFL